MTSNCRRWSFSLRALVVAVTLCCVAGAWAGRQLNWIREREQFENTKAWDLTAICTYGRETRPAPPFQLRLFGERGRSVLSVEPHDADAARRLFPEAEIDVIGPLRPMNSERVSSVVPPSEREP